MKFNGSIIANAFGDLHIQNDAVALSEQIKNAVDANAKEIIFDFSCVSEKQEMMIIDNGDGMAPKEFEEEWNTIGDSSKSDDIDMIGGKGIGRFSLFRIANDITIYTKKMDNLPCCIDLNYELLLKQEDLSQFDFPVKIIEQNEWEKLSNIVSGTIIVLKNTKNMNYNFIKRELENINIPFEKKKIDIIYKFPEDEVINEYYKPEDVSIYAPFNLCAIFNDGKIEECECKIRDSMGKVRVTNSMNVLGINEAILSSLTNDEEGYSIDKHILKELGKIKIYIDSFFFDRGYVKNTTYKTTDIQSLFLSAYQGINIYRNKIKIFGFGRNDFLKLAEKRLKRAADNIDNKQTFGYVEIEKQTKDKLKEQTNREGFIADDYSYALNIIIEKVIEVIGKFRETNKQLMISQNFDNKKENHLSINKPPKISTQTRDPNELNKIISDSVLKQLDTNISLSDIDIKVDTSKYNETQLGTQYIPVEVKHKNDGTRKLNFSVDVSYVKPKVKTEEALLYFNQELMEKLKVKNKKLFILLNELISLNIYQYPNACAYLLRSVMEISFNLYIAQNITSCDLKRFEYDKKEEELYRLENGKRKTINSRDRVDTTMYILEKINAPVFQHSKNKTIIDGIININFTVHKENNFTIPKNLLQFYNDISQIIEYVLQQISV